MNLTELKTRFPLLNWTLYDYRNGILRGKAPEHEEYRGMFDALGHWVVVEWSNSKRLAGWQVVQHAPHLDTAKVVSLDVWNGSVVEGE
jgi:hypothetical protein